MPRIKFLRLGNYFFVTFDLDGSSTRMCVGAFLTNAWHGHFVSHFHFHGQYQHSRNHQSFLEFNLLAQTAFKIFAFLCAKEPTFMFSVLGLSLMDILNCYTVTKAVRVLPIFEQTQKMWYF